MSTETRTGSGGTHRRLLPHAAVALTALVLWSGAFAGWLVGASNWAHRCAVLATVTTVILIIVGLLGRELVVVTVDGSSMWPTYQHRDRVIVRRGRRLAVGQVVVVEHPGHDATWATAPAPPVTRQMAARKWMIKRISAMPGDQVPKEHLPAGAGHGVGRVPSGMLVLLGDNQGASWDSRIIGYFPAERVLGAVLCPRHRLPRP